MYCDFYQLRERPFNVTSDPKFLYLNACYREALASLNYGITQRKGFITLIGEAGTGKTTLLKKLMDDLDENTRTVFIFNTNVSFDEMLEYIFHELDLPVHNGKRLYMLQRLNSFLLDELREGRNLALLIDEAQDLEYPVMEDLRLLSNLETAKEKILQIVLSGQPELGQKLGNPSLRQLRQRVAINCRLQPLSPDEVSEYIQARLMAAGCVDPRVFSRDAEAKIYEISRGIPRLVNIVCDNAMVIGYALAKKRIGGDVVTEASADLFSAGELSDAGREPAATAEVVQARGRRWGFLRGGWAASQLALVAVVMAVLLGFIGHGLLGREATVTPPTVARRPLEVVAPARRAEDGDAMAAEHDAAVPPRRGELQVERRAPVRAESMPSRAMREEPGVPDAELPGRVGTGLAVGRVQTAPERVEAPVLGAPGVEAPPKVVAVPEAGEEPVVPAERRDQAGADAARQIAAPQMPVAAEQVAALPAAGDALPPQPRAPVLDETEAARQALAAIEGSRQVVAPPAELPAEEPAGPPVEARPPVPVEPARARTAEGAGADLTVAMPRKRLVTVAPGDSLSAIAIRSYGQATPTILDLVKLANPSIEDVDLISVGQRLELPALVEGPPVLRGSDGRYSLLVLSTPLQRRVNALGVALSKKGFRAEVRRTSFGAGRTVYRLLVPGFADREAALAEGEQLKRMFREDEQIAALAR